MTDEILMDLAQRLQELRTELQQVRTDLSGGEFGKNMLRCHTCGRQKAADQAGWTLRLWADDELHAFCPDCDRRHLRRDGAGRRAFEAPSQEMHGLTLSRGNHTVTDAGLPL